MTKQIGILTSGGDCAGPERHDPRRGAARPSRLRLDDGGHPPRHAGPAASGRSRRRPLDPARLDAALARQGGTFLGSTNRGDPFAFPMPDGTPEGPLGRDGRGPARARTSTG